MGACHSGWFQGGMRFVIFTSFCVHEDYYSDRYLIASLDRYLASGANYLLNVGPTAEGLINGESRLILNRIGHCNQIETV